MTQGDVIVTGAGMLPTAARSTNDCVSGWRRCHNCATRCSPATPRLRSVALIWSTDPLIQSFDTIDPCPYALTRAWTRD